MACSCFLGVPLAYYRDSVYLMILGTVTLAVVLLGWVESRAARRAHSQGDFETASRRLRRHLILMGASYIGAWSGFFATNPVFGSGEWQVWAYVFGPSAIGAVFITMAVRRLQERSGKLKISKSKHAKVG
jgi:Na+/proline symporter